MLEEMGDIWTEAARVKLGQGAPKVLSLIVKSKVLVEKISLMLKNPENMEDMWMKAATEKFKPPAPDSAPDSDPSAAEPEMGEFL